MKTLSLLTCILPALMFSALPTSASEHASSAKTYTVRYNPTELTTQAGRNAVLKRIRSTAQDVCKDEFGGERFLRKLDMHRCINQISKNLVAQTGNKNLEAMRAQHKHRDKPVKLATRTP